MCQALCSVLVICVCDPQLLRHTVLGRVFGTKCTIPANTPGREKMAGREERMDRGPLSLH